VPDTGGPHPQRGTDHIGTVGPAQQARHRQQHMRHQAAATTGAARTQHPDTPNVALAGIPPRNEITTARAHQLTSPQTSFDLENVRTYHDHGCLHQHQGTALPSGQATGRAVALPERDQTVVAHEHEATRMQPL
jgi:hypothetical protein